MQDIQEIFSRIQENKKKMKDLKSSYKDGLASSQQYQDISDELKVMREKRKSVESAIRDGFTSEFTKIEDLKIDLESDMELLSDIAMTRLMKGQTVEVKDEYENDYSPTFKVSFKKIT